MKARFRRLRRTWTRRDDMATFDRAVRNAEPNVRTELLAAAARDSHIQSM